MTVRSLAAAIVFLAAVPAVAGAGHVFEAGTYAGTSDQGRPVAFAAGEDGVREFAVRVRMRCGDDRKVVRIRVRHIEGLDQATGTFEYVRRPRPGKLLRVTGRLSGMAATGTVKRKAGGCRSGTRRWSAEHQH